MTLFKRNLDTKNEVPIWFPGNQTEWDLLLKVSSCLDEADFISVITNSKGDSSILSKVLDISVGAIAGVSVSVAFFLNADPSTTGLTRFFFALVFGILVFGAGGMFTNIFSESVASLFKRMARPLWLRYMNSTLAQVSKGLTEIGRRRLEMLKEGCGLATRKLKAMEGMKDHVDSSAYVQKLTIIALDHLKSMELEASEKSRLIAMAEELRRDMPDLFERNAKDDLKEATLEGRLTHLGNLGADGLAAVALWRGMGAEGTHFELEMKTALYERIPRLLDAFSSVPSNEREIARDVLNGESPSGSLRRGLKAALESALSARAALSERAAVNVEAEARVLEEAVKG